MEQLSIEDWKPDACPKNITVEEYLATFPKPLKWGYMR